MTPEARSLLDLAVLLVLVVSALLGAASGGLRQLVSVVAAAAGVLASRAFAHDVGEGLARSVSAAARPVAPVLLFFGVFALVSLVGGLILRGTGLARVVRGPSDRAAGALLAGVKGALGAWVMLSAFVLARDHLPARARAWAAGSDFAAVSRTHNLVARLEPEAARRLEKLQGAEDLERLEESRRRLEDLSRQRREALDRLERPER